MVPSGETCFLQAMCYLIMSTVYCILYSLATKKRCKSRSLFHFSPQSNNYYSKLSGSISTTFFAASCFAAGSYAIGSRYTSPLLANQEDQDKAILESRPRIKLNLKFKERM